MSTQKNVSKDQLLKAIDNLEKNDNLGGFLLDIGVGAVGAVGAGAAASVLGATAFLGLIPVAAPLAVVVGGAALGGAALVGLKKMLFDGTFDEGKKAEMLRQYKDQLRELEAKEKASTLTDNDKTKFIILLKDPIRLNLISPEKAQQLIDAVTNGQMPLKEAYRLVENVVKAAN